MLDQIQKDSRGRALVSDDDDFFRVAINSVLRERNGFCEVIETASFNDAVDRLDSAGKFDIGLFDLNMVGMDNWLDLSALRLEYPEMRLVVVSASRKREDILRALEIGAHGFIHKGLGVGELSRAVELVCNGQVYVPPFLPENAVVPIKAAPWQSESGAADQRAVFTPDAAGAPDGAQNTARAPNGAQVVPRKRKLLNCSPRQREIIELLIAGQSNKAMARSLELSEGTIKFHMSAVMRLLGVNNRVEAATRAMTMLAE